MSDVLQTVSQVGDQTHNTILFIFLWFNASQKIYGKSVTVMTSI